MAIVKETYEGTINKDKKLHGKGKITFTDGKTLEGYFKEGNISGLVNITFPDKTKYFGEINSSGQPHGKGKLTKNNGEETYNGKFENGLYEGLGVLKKKYGETTKTIKGKFIGGKLSQDPNDSVYFDHLNDTEHYYYRGNIAHGVFESTKGLGYTLYLKPASPTFWTDNENVDITGTCFFDNGSYLYEGNIKNFQTTGEGIFMENYLISGFRKNYQYYSKTFGNFDIRNLTRDKFYNNKNYIMEDKSRIKNEDFKNFSDQMGIILSKAYTAGKGTQYDQMHYAIVDLKKSIDNATQEKVNCTDCFTYKGEFDKVTGFITGNGKLTTDLGTYEGTFDTKGVLHFGKFNEKDNTYRSEGELNEKLQLHGKSKIVFNTGKTKIGIYENGYLKVGTIMNKENGIYKGVKTYENGDIYKGDFSEDGVPKDKGKLTFINHEIYDVFEGSFENEVPKIGKLTFKGTDTYYMGPYIKKPLKLQSGVGQTTFKNNTKLDGFPVIERNNKLIVLTENEFRNMNSNMTNQDRENKLNFISKIVHTQENKLKQINDVNKVEATQNISNAKNILQKKELLTDKVLDEADKIKTEISDFLKKATLKTTILEAVNKELDLLKDTGKDITSLTSKTTEVKQEKDVDKAVNAAKDLKEKVVKAVKDIEQTKKLISETKTDLKSIKELVKEKDVTKIENGITEAEKETDISKALEQAVAARQLAADVLREVSESANKTKLKKIAWGVAGVAGVSYYLYNKFKKSKKESTKKKKAVRSSARHSHRSSAKHSHRSSAKHSHRSSAKHSHRSSSRHSN